MHKSEETIYICKGTEARSLGSTYLRFYIKGNGRSQCVCRVLYSLDGNEYKSFGTVTGEMIADASLERNGAFVVPFPTEAAAVQTQQVHVKFVNLGPGSIAVYFVRWMAGPVEPEAIQPIADLRQPDDPEKEAGDTKKAPNRQALRHGEGEHPCEGQTLWPHARAAEGIYLVQGCGTP